MHNRFEVDLGKIFMSSLLKCLIGIPARPLQYFSNGAGGNPILLGFQNSALPARLCHSGGKDGVNKYYMSKNINYPVIYGEDYSKQQKLGVFSPAGRAGTPFRGVQIN